MLKKITYDSTYGAVEHTLDENGKELFNVLLLKKKKQELVVKEKKQVHSFDDVITLLNSQKHIFLIVNDGQVLTKKKTAIDDNTIATVRNTFPNITLDDFFYEVISSNDTSLVAISRKNYINSLLEHYKKKGVSVVGFSLGNIAIHNLTPFITVDELHTSNAKITFENDTIKNFRKEFSPVLNYRINDLEVTNNDVLPLSGILEYYFENHNSNGLENKISNLKTQYQQSACFNLGLYSMLGLLFSVLLINFLVFSNYHSKINQLSTEVLALDNYKEQLITLNNQASQKEKLINSLQATTNSRVSFYFDEIAQIVPATILLSEINYQPLKARIKKDKELQFNFNQIVLKGIAKINDDFTNFISNLEQKEWIEKVTIVNYGKDKSTINSFEVLIDLQDE